MAAGKAGVLLSRSGILAPNPVADGPQAGRGRRDHQVSLVRPSGRGLDRKEEWRARGEDSREHLVEERSISRRSHTCTISDTLEEPSGHEPQNPHYHSTHIPPSQLLSNRKLPSRHHAQQQIPPQSPPFEPPDRDPFYDSAAGS